MSTAKKLWIFGGGAVVLLAIAAILIFVVFAGNAAGWPFSGNTLQTKFINDGVKVFTGAFSDLNARDTQKIVSEPFDLEMNLSASTDGTDNNASIKMAYDKQSLGVALDSDGASTILLLLGDTLYTQASGYVSGMKFDTAADLSKPMTLEDRIAALTESDENPDYMKLVELLVNSIGEDCFKKDAQKTTLTLDADAVVDMLSTFADKLEEDEALNGMISDLIEQESGMPLDLSDAIPYITAAFTAADLDFEVVIEVTYNGGSPVGIEVSYSDAGSESNFDFSFDYETDGFGKDIAFSLVTAEGYSDFSGTLTIDKTDGGFQYHGDVTSIYDNETVLIAGSESWAGDDVTGTVEVTAGEEKYSVEYNGTLAFGMPGQSVEDDSRFAVDTENATVTDMSDIFSLFDSASAAQSIDAFDLP